MTTSGRARPLDPAEQVSPELVLVDAELAARARASLPDDDARELEPQIAPLPRRDSFVAPSPYAVPVRPTSELLEEPERHPVALRKPRPRRLLAILTLALLVGIASAVLIWTPRKSSRLPAVVEHVSTTVTAPEHAPFTTSSDGRTPTTRAPRAAPAATTSLPITTTLGSRPDPSPSVPRPQPAPKRAPPAPRLFNWAPVPAATYYLVTFYRGMEEIYVARPGAPRVALRSTWIFAGRHYRLTPGRYRWSVRVGLGRRAAARYGKLIVEATLVVQERG
jgi:hypothetical protein